MICLEEPERNIHPSKISTILQLLQDIAIDPQSKIGKDNLLRQVTIDTHSPVILRLVPEDSLIFAELRDTVDREGRHFQRSDFTYLANTWREKSGDPNRISNRNLLSHLDPVFVRQRKLKMRAID